MHIHMFFVCQLCVTHSDPLIDREVNCSIICGTFALYDRHAHFLLPYLSMKQTLMLRLVLLRCLQHLGA
jgi:hypothetical protein